MALTVVDNEKGLLSDDQNQICIILAVLHQTCYQWRGPYPRLSVWATQPRKNVAAMMSH